MSRGWQRAAALAAAGFFSVLVAVGVLEGVLRLGWIPNLEHIHHQIRGEREAPLARVLILGDSFMIPWRSTGRLVAEGLGEHGFAVLNLAISGTGPFEYLAELESSGVDFEPQVVILSYYVGNDLTDVQRHPRFQEGSAERSGIGINTSRGPRLLRQLYSFHYLVPYLKIFRARRFDAQRMAAAGIAPDLIEDARALRMNPYLLELALQHPDHLLENTLMESAENMTAWIRVRQLLTEIHEICQRIGAELLIVVFPRSIQINDSHFDFFRRLTFNVDERTLVSAKPQALMAGLCKERGFGCLDLLPAFRARMDQELYLENDDHLNDEGHRLAAESIVRFVVGDAPI